MWTLARLKKEFYRQRTECMENWNDWKHNYKTFQSLPIPDSNLKHVMLSLVLRKVAKYRFLGWYSSYKHCIFLPCLQPHQNGFIFFASFSQTRWDYFAGKEKEAPSNCTTTTTAPCNTVQATSSASVVEDDDSAPSRKKSKNQKLRRPGHQRHRPETKAKIDLFKKIRSSEKLATEIKRSPEELKLWDLFKSGKCLTEWFCI